LKACHFSLLFWTENFLENTTSAQPSPYRSGKGYTHSKDFHNSKKSGKAGTSFGIQQRAEKSARNKRSTKSVLHGLPDSDGSDSEFVGTPSSRSRSHILDIHQKSFQNGGIGLTTPQSSGLTERERVRTKSRSMVILFFVQLYMLIISYLPMITGAMVCQITMIYGAFKSFFYCIKHGSFLSPFSIIICILLCLCFVLLPLWYLSFSNASFLLVW
jgi:hypothetical protein